jgi:hypothetical protein
MVPRVQHPATTRDHAPGAIEPAVCGLALPQVSGNVGTKQSEEEEDMTFVAAPAALTTTEQSELELCEQTINHLRQAFADAGAALGEIREKRLYRAQYGTFEAYCQQRWGFSRVQAHRLIQAAEVSHNLLPIGNIVGLPDNEAQTRPLGKLDTPEEQQGAWREAVERSNGSTPTAKVVQQVVEERTRSSTTCESCGATATSSTRKDGREVWLCEQHREEEREAARIAVEEWANKSGPAAAEPPPEKNAFENIMHGAMVGAEFDAPALAEEEDKEEEEPAVKPVFGLQPDFTYQMSPSEKRLCSKIGDQYGCTVRQVVDGQGRPQELWNATCEGVTIATTNTLQNMPVYIKQAIAWKSEYEHEMAKRGHHLVTMVGDKVRFAVDYLPKTASGGLQTVDLSLSRIAAIRKRSLKHQGAINIYLSMLAQDGHLVSAVNALGNPVELFAWLEQQGYQFAVTTWQAPPQSEAETQAAADAAENLAQRAPEPEPEPDEEEIALPDDWVCSKILHNERHWWRAYAMLPGLETNMHPTEESAIRQAIYIKRLDKRFHELGWKLQHLRTEGWQLQRTFKGDNAPGEIEDFLYELERLL